nr:hypothetical protein BaRGS_010318 [Batillaria attramentaria]
MKGGEGYNRGGQHENLTSINSTNDYNRNCYGDRQANNNHSAKSDYYTSNDHFKNHDYHNNPKNDHYHNNNNDH